MAVSLLVGCDPAYVDVDADLEDEVAEAGDTSGGGEAPDLGDGAAEPADEPGPSGPGEVCGLDPTESLAQGRKWPGGIIPYTIKQGGGADEFSATQAANIRQAMDDWEARVPGVEFRPATNEAVILTVQRGGSSWAGTGYLTTKPRIMQLEDAAVDLDRPIDLVHHELGHVLGMPHTQARDDRDLYLAVQWDRVRGCLASATDPSDCGWEVCDANNTPDADCECSTAASCDKYEDLLKCSDPKSEFGACPALGEYDYFSIMHYRPYATRKKSLGGLSHSNPPYTLTYPDSSSLPAGTGDKDKITDNDRLAANAMYPVLKFARVVFAAPGTEYEPCWLSGRREDIATAWTVDDGVFPRYSQGTAGRAFAHAAQWGTTATVTCTALNFLWGATYDYPNDQVSYSTAQSQSDSGTPDTYEGEATVKFLNPGLLPTLL